MIRKLTVSAALLACLLASSMALAQSEGPSLADVARQKSATKSKRVVTNDEIPPSPDADKPAETKKPAAPATNAAEKEAAAKPQAAPEARLQQLTKENEDTLRVIGKLQEKIEATDDKKLI